MKDKTAAELQADINSITEIIQLILELDEIDRGKMQARAEILLEDPKYFRRRFKLITNDKPAQERRPKDGRPIKRHTSSGAAADD